VLTALAAASLILATWLLVLTLFVGIGAALRAAGRGGYRRPDDLLVDSWLGFVAVIAVLQVWNLVLPVDGRAWLPLILLALWGLRRARPQLAPLLRGPWPSGERWLAVAVVLAGLWIANRASGSSGLVDDGLYHLQMVKWHASYPILPGLGNLHGRFAFNQSGFLYAALLDVGPWKGGAIHLASGALLWLLAIQGALGVRRLVRDPVLPGSALFDALLLVPAFDMTLHRESASLTTDLPLTVLLLVSGSRLYRVLEDAGGEARPVGGFDLAAAALLLAAVPVLKLSGAVYGLLGLGLLAVVWWRGRRGAGTSPVRALGPLILGLGLLTVPWLIRGVIISGYPAYPLAVAGLPVAWQVPPIQARVESAYVTSHARLLSLEGLGVGSQWLSDWPGRIWRRKFLWGGSLVPLAAALVAGGVILRRRFLRRDPATGSGREYWLLLVTGAALAAWFALAPAIRFAAGLIWVTAATLICAATAPALSRQRRAVALFAPAALMAAILTVKGLEGGWRGPGRFLRSVVEIPEPSRLFAPLPHQSWDTVQTDHGLALLVPRGGNLLCWDAPLPCTPHPNRSLALRRPGDLSSGFILDGPWEPRDWPAPGGAYLDLWRCLHEPGVSRSPVREQECLARATARAVVAP